MYQSSVFDNGISTAKSCPVSTSNNSTGFDNNSVDTITPAPYKVQTVSPARKGGVDGCSIAMICSVVLRLNAGLKLSYFQRETREPEKFCGDVEEVISTTIVLLL